MFKSIFAKQFTIVAVSLSISFGAVAFGLSAVFSRYFIDERGRLLNDQAQKVASRYIEYANTAYFGVNPGGIRGLAGDMTALSTYLGTSCFIVDETGAINFATMDLASADFEHTITYEPFLRTLGNERYDAKDIREIGTGGGMFGERKLTVGVPIKLRSGVVLGAVFINAPLAEISRQVSNIRNITFIALIGSLTVSFVLFWFSTRSITRPIRDINAAAGRVAAGDLSVRLDIKGKDEVARLADSFNDMAGSLAGVEAARTEFLGNISHDLRSPLTSVKGFVEAIRDGVVPKESEGRYLGIILEETERLTMLANDILTDSSQASDLDISDFDINELIRKTVSLFEGRVAGKELAVELDFCFDESYIAADYDKVSRILYNLVDNAVKFSYNRGEIKIATAYESAAHTARSGRVMITVSDNGPGLTPEESRKVFDKFYKTDASRGADKTGHGLGLSIVRSFVLAHGQTVECRAERGKGCAFTFYMERANL